jgi:UDP-N-acetylmuramoylalanine--D-glutamate ligase
MAKTELISKKIGIIGFGVVGKSFLRFLASNLFSVKILEKESSSSSSDKFSISVWDQRILTNKELELLRISGTLFIENNCGMEEFVGRCDYVLCSAAVDVSVVKVGREKLISEIDLFRLFYTFPTISITGTLGKTTLTKLISEMISLGFNKKTVAAGNIGIGLSDLIVDEQKNDVAVLELSSYQLEHNRGFSSSLAIISNIFPNHIDRHGSLEKYLVSKLNIFKFAKPRQVVLINVSCLEDKNISGYLQNALKTCEASIVFVSSKEMEEEVKKEVESLGASVIDLFKGKIRFRSSDELAVGGCGLFIFDAKNIPSSGYLENWIIALSAVFLMYGELDSLSSSSKAENKKKNILENAFKETEKSVGGNRLQLFASIHDVDVFNDSKATVIQAVEAAVNELGKKYSSIILIVGGQNKGVCRASAIKKIASNKKVKSIISVGEHKDYKEHSIFAESMEVAVKSAFNFAKPGDAILFSPGGASFDFYKNYEERGQDFVRLVSLCTTSK